MKTLVISLILLISVNYVKSQESDTLNIPVSSEGYSQFEKIFEFTGVSESDLFKYSNRWAKIITQNPLHSKLIYSENSAISLVKIDSAKDYLEDYLLYYFEVQLKTKDNKVKMVINKVCINGKLSYLNEKDIKLAKKPSILIGQKLWNDARAKGKECIYKFFNNYQVFINKEIKENNF